MMYRERIIESIGKVYQVGVATKILQYMNKIRNESDITQARRWVMELLQNARDLAWEDKPLLVQIELKDNALYFRHNGKPFRVKDILSIINQVSSKNPGEGVGQFGTGFMTTYQLSEKVEIHSILKDEDIPGKKFSVTLDRTGHSREAILDAISHNLEQLGNADTLPDVSEESIGEGYDTEFCYLLESKRSRDIKLRMADNFMDQLEQYMYYYIQNERQYTCLEFWLNDSGKSTMLRLLPARAKYHQSKYYYECKKIHTKYELEMHETLSVFYYMHF